MPAGEPSRATRRHFAEFLEMVKKRREARLERDLMKAWTSCHGTSVIQDPTIAPGPVPDVIQHFHSILNAAADRPVYGLEMATAIGTTLRSLSRCCEKHLGIGIGRYLLLRRLHLARRALCAADPAATTVPDVATRYGFWQFNQFSGQYKSFFGESPSDTLRKAPTRQA